MNVWSIADIPVLDGRKQYEIIIGDSAYVQDAIAKAFNDTWKDALLGAADGTTSPLYGALANVGACIAVIAILFWVIQWAKAMLDDAGINHFDRLIWPMIVVIFLVNDGFLLAHSTLGLRGTVNALNAMVMKGTQRGMDLEKSYRDLSRTLGDKELARAQYLACLEEKDEAAQNKCLKDRKAEADKTAQGENWFGYWLDKLGSAVGKVGQSLENLQNVGFWIVRLLFSVMGVAFQWMAELSMLLVALIGPLAVGVTLLPVTGSQKPLIAWIIAFMTIGFAKMMFAVMIGLTAVVMSKTEITDFNSMVFSFITGFGAPLLSTMVSKNGGQAVYHSLKDTTMGAIGKGTGLVVGAAVGAATGGTGAGAMMVRAAASKVSSQGTSSK